MREIWERETKKNLYAVYGDKPVCNEPLISKEKFDYMAAKGLLDYTFNDDGSFRVSINWHKATPDSFKQMLDAAQQMIDNLPGNEE